MKKLRYFAMFLICSILALGSTAWAHGNVTPQAIDSSDLPQLGEQWRDSNPYRELDKETSKRIIEIGASGYNQNCARCHGLQVISGGIAPDLRNLEPTEYDDQWFLERIRGGYTRNNTTYMPAFEEIFSQEAMWAIRTYIETRSKKGL